MILLYFKVLEEGEVAAIRSDKTPLLSMRGTTVEPSLRLLLRRSLLSGQLGEDIDILEDFTYLGSVVQNKGGGGGGGGAG